MDTLPAPEGISPDQLLQKLQAKVGTLAGDAAAKDAYIDECLAVIARQDTLIAELQETCERLTEAMAAHGIGDGPVPEPEPEPDACPVVSGEEAA